MGFKRILVTGASGMLGQDLTAFLTLQGYTVTGLSSKELNLLETQEAILKKVAQYEPEIIIHSAAFTNVDEAERTPDLAMAVNKDGTKKIALAAKELDTILAFISTDYVFDGQKQGAYQTTDRPNPIGAYGLSKYYGELMVSELLDTYYIIRTSWLYGVHGRNFVQFVIDGVRQGRELTIIQDQWGGPTWTGSLCHSIEKIITSGAYGIYHGVDHGKVSRYEQAVTICKAMGLSSDAIKPIWSRDFPQPAPRPVCSVLDPEELCVPNWETSLQAYLEQYLNRD